MRRSAGQASDLTGQIALGNVAGESLLFAILSRIDDELDRVLILAHVGLDYSFASLARDLKVDRREVAQRIEETLTVLRSDAELTAELCDIGRVGQAEHYHALAFRLNLQDWFCSHCGRLMVQPEIGRPRNTCSNRCRRLLYEAGGTGWKDRYQRASSKDTRTPISTLAMRNEAAWHGKLFELMKLIEFAHDNTKSPPNLRVRDRAMFLLGFTCPIPLSSADLAEMDIDDFRQDRRSMEVRLYRRANRATQYVTVPAAADPALCAVKTMQTWRSHLVRSGRTTGPLFIRMDRDGLLPGGAVRRLTARAIAGIVNDSLGWGQRLRAPELLPSMPLPEFLTRATLAN